MDGNFDGKEDVERESLGWGFKKKRITLWIMVFPGVETTREIRSAWCIQMFDLNDAATFIRVNGRKEEKSGSKVGFVRLRKRAADAGVLLRRELEKDAKLDRSSTRSSIDPMKNHN